MKVAVVGSGVAGLTAAYRLRESHEVTLFEAAERLGGHSYTVDVDTVDGTVPVDLGFIVFNHRTYPGFVRLLRELGVEELDSDMSFSVRCEASGFEYNGSSLDQLFAQRSNLLRLSYWGMLVDILRFHRTARRVLHHPGDPTLGDMVKELGLGQRFVEHYLLPMVAAIWSAERQAVMRFSARMLVRFMDNHGMLTVDQRPVWKTVRGGSRSYVARIAAALGDRVRLGCPVARVRRLHGGGVRVEPVGSEAETFDRVVIAAHSDQALRLLEDPSPAEHQVLGAIPYQPNEVVLHRDSGVMPRRHRAWASWNVHLGDQARNEERPVQLTYHMNRLQGLATRDQLFVTLNRSRHLDPDAVLRTVTFHHPVLTAAAVEAQQRWSEVNGLRDTYFCGAYWGYGFHEDGVRSALRVCEALGVAR